MVTPISKKTQKRFRQGAKTVEHSIKNLRPGRKNSHVKSTVAAGTGVVAVAAAGVAVAVHLLRKESHDEATFHVNVNANGDGGWALRAEGSDDPVQTFPTKASAVRAARKAAADAAPSDLLIHLSDGTVQATHSYHTA